MHANARGQCALVPPAGEGMRRISTSSDEDGLVGVGAAKMPSLPTRMGSPEEDSKNQSELRRSLCSPEERCSSGEAVIHWRRQETYNKKLKSRDCRNAALPCFCYYYCSFSHCWYRFFVLWPLPRMSSISILRFACVAACLAL